MVAKDLLPLTPIEEACRVVLVKFYHQTKGNISQTAKKMGWPRTKVLKLLHAYKLYSEYPHDPGPIPKEK